MINQIRYFSLFIFLSFTSSLFAVNVTLNVDMSSVTVSENGVHVAGSFQGWDPAGTQLTDDDGDGVYTVVVDMSGITDETVFFKYLKFIISLMTKNLTTKYNSKYLEYANVLIKIVS